MHCIHTTDIKSIGAKQKWTASHLPGMLNWPVAMVAFSLSICVRQRYKDLGILFDGNRKLLHTMSCQPIPLYRSQLPFGSRHTLASLQKTWELTSWLPSEADLCPRLIGRPVALRELPERHPYLWRKTSEGERKGGINSMHNSCHTMPVPSKERGNCYCLACLYLRLD